MEHRREKTQYNRLWRGFGIGVMIILAGIIVILPVVSSTEWGYVLQDDFNDGLTTGWVTYSGSWGAANGYLEGAGEQAFVYYPFNYTAGLDYDVKFSYRTTALYATFTYLSNGTIPGAPTDYSKYISPTLDASWHDVLIEIRATGGITATFNGVAGVIPVNNNKFIVYEHGAPDSRFDNLSIYEYHTKLIYPTDNFISDNSSINFNCSAITNGTQLSNMSLWTNLTGTWAINQTKVMKGTSNSTIFNISNKDVAGVLWNCRACDAGNNCGFGKDNQTFGINTANPIISINAGSGVQSYGSLSINHTINYTISDSNLQTCWLNYNSINKTIPCTSGSQNTTNFALQSGVYNAIIYANNSVGGLSNLSFNWSYVLLENSQTYSSSTTETSSESFAINITYNSALWSGIIANLIYNNTDYSGIVSGTGDNKIFSRTIQIPAVASQENKTFYWMIGLSNTTGIYYYNSTSNNQTINKINFGVCAGSLNIIVLNFTAVNETTLIKIYNFSFAGTFEIWKSGGVLASTVSTINTSVIDNLQLCISENTTYKINADIDYSKTGFADRSYYIRSGDISNITNNIKLYLLETGSATSIIINTKDKYLTNLKNHLVKILRYYPGYGAYYLVETSKTDDFGNAIIKAHEEDVDYRIQIENSTGYQIYSSNPMRIICTATPCSLNFITGLTEHIVQELIDFSNIQYTLTWNNNTGYANFEFSDSTGLTQSMRFVVVKLTGYGEVILPGCNNIIIGSAGVSTCYIGSNATGEYLARVYRTASPSIYFTELHINLTNAWQTFGVEGLVWMFLFAIVMFFAGLAAGPATAAIMTLVSIVFMMTTGIVYMPLVVVISIAIVVVIFIIKMRS